MKKFILGFAFALMTPVMFAYAATPVLTVTGTGDNNNVTVRVTEGEIYAPVVLFYNQHVSAQGVQQHTLGTTDIHGNFTGTVSTNGLGISQASPVYVQVGGYQSLPVNWPYSGTASISSNAIVFSQSAPTFIAGHSGTVTVSGGGGGTYYVSSNSSPNIAGVGISGNTLTFNSSALPGQTTITVCSTSGPCGVISANFVASSATTTPGPVGSGAPMLSASTVNVNQGGQNWIALSGGVTPYTVSVTSGNSVSTTLIGNTLYINGDAPGVTMFNICSANASNTTSASCSPLTVNVQGATATTPSTGTTGSPLSFVLPVTYGDAVRLSLSGGSGSYYLQTSGNFPVMASVNGNMLTISGAGTGSGTVTVCSTGTTGATPSCLPIIVAVSQSLSGTGGGHYFGTNLSMGMSGRDVLELQNRLRDEGYFKVAPTGYYGSITATAVRAYQAANGISPVGVVGPQTRTLLNQ